MELEIRRARAEDAPALFELITALAHYEKLDPPDDEAKARMLEHGWNDRPRFEAWLVESGGRPVAYAIAFETYSTFLALPTLYLEDIFVLPDFRRAGVGYHLFRRIAADAHARGCGRMEWACLDWNEPGLNFYRKIGADPLSDWRYFRLNRDQMVLPDSV